jgi:oxygen-independent coproporphyrinogen III oxidase
MTYAARPIGPNWYAKTSDARTGCYVHLPFCDRICPYCDFAVARVAERQVERYMPALISEIQECSSASLLARIQTLYFGGGTPSALSTSWLARLTQTLFERFDTKPDSVEFTLEANPSRNMSELSALRGIGVNRLSIGVQSFDDAELHRLGREHDAAQASDYFRAARAAGLENINLDLIAGVPGQSSDSFERSLEWSLRLGADHLSVYGLTIEEGTPYARWQRRNPRAFPDDDAIAVLLELAHDRLTAAGMIHYEISNFAQPGFECAHNLGYWHQRDCLAFGLSAAGYHDGVRYANVRDLLSYCELIESGKSPIGYQERLSSSARIGEAAMLALRTHAGINNDDFRKRYGVDPNVAFATVREKCKNAGLLEEDDRGARLTRSGRLLANSVCAEFLEPVCEVSG